MTALFPTLDQMLFLLLCMMAGFLLNKLKLLPENAGTTIGGIRLGYCIKSSFQNIFCNNLS